MTLIEILKQQLGQDAACITPSGELNPEHILYLARAYDPALLGRLLQQPQLKQCFFAEVAGSLIFKLDQLELCLQQCSAALDYTNYKNKIGLSIAGHYVPQVKDVVLVWPYKDCILEGGQTKEEQKRQEVFFHQVLAQPQITQLLAPKVLTQGLHYTASGCSTTIDFKRHAKGQIEQNLIIKGNNLLALHCLKSQFSAQVQLIYIDPPYNTGSDSFAYNDAFRQSTWLTFMKNRVEAAKPLMAPSAIFIAQCSFHQYPHLRLLLDELFAKHLCDFHIQVRHPDRSLTGDKEFNDLIEYVLIYSNDADKKMPYQQIAKPLDAYDHSIELLVSQPAAILQCGAKQVEVYLPEQYRRIRHSGCATGLKKVSVRGSIREKNTSGRFYVQHLEPVFADFPAESVFKVPDMGDDGLGYRYFYSAPTGRKNGGYFQGLPQSTTLTKKPYPNFYNFEQAYNRVDKQGGVSFRNGKKPEQLLKFLIELFTQPGELVLDYHLGSGSTLATAHKLQRRYIGIEQLQNQIDLVLSRMQAVIAGDHTGISSFADVAWQGGGEFVYFELKQNNQRLIEEILAAQHPAQLHSLWQQIQQHSFLNYQLHTAALAQYQAQFLALELTQQQALLIELLDMNQLYVNLSALDDGDFQCSEAEKCLTSDFYQAAGDAHG